MTTMLSSSRQAGSAPHAAMSRHLARALSFGAAAALAVGLVTAPGSSIARGTPESFADLAEKLLPAVVNISTTQEIQGRGPEGFNLPPGSPFEEFFKDFFEREDGGGRRAPVTSLGSGFVIDPSGIIVTNNHVIADADEITVNFSDDSSLRAEVVGHDPKTDIAVLKVEPDQDLPYVSWGDSNAIRVGDWAMAIGNPFGLGGTVTAGIVSARARDINAGPYDDFIQTDASINKGNSGGPLFNMDGDVIGINTAIFSPSGTSIGIGFSISSAVAQKVVQQLREFGRTRRGWLGVRIQQVTDEIAESLGMDEPSGALVASLTAGGPAEESGVEKGDVILRFDNKPVPEMRALQRIVAETEVGKAVDVTVWRKQEEKVIQVTLGELEVAEKTGMLDQTPEMARETDDGVDTLGMKLAEITSDLRGQFDLAETTGGVVITEVDPDSAAAEKGLQPGDVIVEVSQEEVKSPADVAQHIKTARDERKRSVLLLLDRDGDLRFVALRIQDS